MVSVSEKEDFDNALKEHGHASEDFALSQSEDPYPAQGIGPLTGEVTVRNNKTGVARTYAAGHGTAWVVAFEEELRAGVFTT